MDFSKVSGALKKAEEHAKSLGVEISVAVVDEYGCLIGFNRMPGAIKISPKFAIAKAYTSGTIGLPTEDIGGFAEPGKPYFGINSLFSGELTTIAGGLPIMIDGKLVGGVGVGGSTDINQDVECAKKVVEVLSNP